jgi:hypothetical protein
MWTPGRKTSEVLKGIGIQKYTEKYAIILGLNDKTDHGHVTRSGKGSLLTADRVIIVRNK